MRKVKINRDGSITIKRVVTTTIQPKRFIFREVDNPCEDCPYKYECRIDRIKDIINNCF
jgi:hypothetical protein